MMLSVSKSFCACLAVALLLNLAASPATAESHLFFGTDEGGTGSALLTFDFNGNEVVITIENTSPTLLDDLSGENAPAITGFGFDFLTDGSLTGWELTALASDGSSTVQINDTSNGGAAGGTGDWTLSSPGSYGGPWTFDYAPTVGNVKGALYNPDAIGSSALAAEPNYFTTATLTLNFDDEVLGLDYDTNNNPFVRMKNVGEDGEGSLKLTGTPTDDPTGSPAVPEPSSFLLLGIGGMALAGYGYRRKQRRAA